MKTALVAISLLAATAIGGGIYLYHQEQEAREQVKTLRDINYDLLFRVEKLEKDNAELAGRLEEQLSEVSEEKRNEIRQLKTTYEALVEDLQQEIKQGQIKITQLANKLSVRVVEKILFPSGEAEITPEGLKLLQRVGNILKNTEDRIIRVEGHTDVIPIGERLRQRYPSNWELSTTRATNVVRFLEKEVGITPQRLEAVGLSEYHPVATNATVAGRAQNRRIEIRLLSRSSQ